MFDTANELEAIVTNNYRRQNFADVSWWGASKILSIISITTIIVLPFDSTARALLHPGPAVGHGVHGAWWSTAIGAKFGSCPAPRYVFIFVESFHWFSSDTVDGYPAPVANRNKLLMVGGMFNP